MRNTLVAPQTIRKGCDDASKRRDFFKVVTENEMDNYNQNSTRGNICAPLPQNTVMINGWNLFFF
jgi:hypothetical protein